MLIKEENNEEYQAYIEESSNINNRRKNIIKKITKLIGFIGCCDTSDIEKNEKKVSFIIDEVNQICNNGAIQQKPGLNAEESL